MRVPIQASHPLLAHEIRGTLKRSPDHLTATNVVKLRRGIVLTNNQVSNVRHLVGIGPRAIIIVDDKKVSPRCDLLQIAEEMRAPVFTMSSRYASKLKSDHVVVICYDPAESYSIASSTRHENMPRQHYVTALPQAGRVEESGLLSIGLKSCDLTE